MKYMIKACAYCLAIYGFSASTNAQEGSSSIPSTLPDIRDEINQYDSGLLFCNESKFDKISIAIHSWSNCKWTTSGWYSAPKNGYVAALPTIENQYIYYNAQSGNSKWAGEWRYCVHPKKVFSLPSGKCSGQNELHGFNEVVTGDVDKFAITMD